MPETAKHEVNAELAGAYLYLNTMLGQLIQSGKARNSKRRHAEHKKYALLGDRKDLAIHKSLGHFFTRG